MRRWQKIGTILIVLLALLVIAGSALALSAPRAVIGPQAAQAYNLTWDVVASGGSAMSSGSYTLLSTAGQPVVGQSSSSSYSLLHGYWAGFLDFIRELNLPVILRP